MVCIICFDVLALKCDRYLHKVIKPFDYSVVMLTIFIGWNLFMWYGCPMRLKNKSRYNDVNYEMDTSKPNSSILCYIHLQYYLRLQLCSKWTVVDHSLNQLLFKSIGFYMYVALETFGMLHNHLGNYVTFLRFLK